MELVREQISKRGYLDIQQAFTYIDRQHKGVISGTDLKVFLANNKYYATQREL